MVILLVFGDRHGDGKISGLEISLKEKENSITN